ncbi:SPOR domain-containing protein [Paenibacillus sp. GCM10028914]|uniref:SPOR domain-containing protein n=1 Tax=Paenibacillus sp. GCM10028914 TaxID=3273416 RepID=UPI003610EEF4
MNKARMTIRFDREDSREQAVQSQGIQRTRRDDFEQYEHEEVQIVTAPIEIMDQHNFIQYDDNRMNKSRASARFADEQRLEVYDDEYLSSHESDYYETDAYAPYHSEVETTHVTNDYGYYRSRKPNSIWKVAGSITGAIVTGLLFGTVVLSMFNDGGSSKAPSISGAIQGTDSDPSNHLVTNEEKIIGDEAVPAAVTVAIPEQTFYLLQYGVFSSAERVEQAKDELSKSGIAAFGESSPENRVYAGVSPDREQAKLLSSQLKNEGMELYVREITLPGAQSAVFAGEAAALDIFFEVSGELTAELSSLSASLLGIENPGSVDAESMKTITGLHLQWTEAVKLISQDLNLETGAGLTAMEKEMNGAITALTEYNKNQSKGHLWEIQAGMMNYIMGQRKLVESL